MARHDVWFNVPERRLGKTDIEFAVFENDERLGILKISKGNLVWRPANKKLGYVATWAKFDTLMQEHGRRERRRG